MKQLLLIFTLFCASYMTVNAQTNTWTGNADNNWSNVGNWSLNAVPTAGNDVVIPTGKTVTLNVAGTTKSIVVQGNSTLNMPNNLSILNASSFATNVTVNWTANSFIGGGTLTNNGTIILSSGDLRYVSGGTTLINNGTITMPLGGNLYLYDNSILNNTASGVFDIQSDANVYRSGSSHNFINAGLLKKSAGDGNSNFASILTNTGTISIESGTLSMTELAKTFNAGVYNVSTGSSLILAIQVDVSNTLVGELDGALNWANNVSVATTATFDFTGDIGVSWTANSLIGGGVLTNVSTINLTTAGLRYISDGTTLTNNGIITMPSDGNLYLYDTSILNNTISGVFDIQSNANVYRSGSTHNFINSGLLKKSAGDGNSNFGSILTNTGTISIESGTLTMTELAKSFNAGVYNVSTDSSLILGIQIDASNTLTGVLNGSLNWANNVSVATSATFNFTGNTGVTWTANSLIGGGTLTNMSTVSLTTAGLRYISAGTTLINNGTITMPSDGNLYLYDTSILNNTASGVFDIQSNANVYRSGIDTHNFINAGVLKKSAGDGNSNFASFLTNTGCISVESGTLTMTELTKTFNGGVYNVSTDSSLILAIQTDVSNTLTGVLNGSLNWANNVSVASMATFDFTGDTGVLWTANSLIGGGNLNNASNLTLSSGNPRYISGEDTTLTNTGNILLPSGGFWYLYNNATIDNQTSGVIDFQSDASVSYSGNGAFSINNDGVIMKTGGTGTSTIMSPTTNSGIIDVSSGILQFADSFEFNNAVNGTVKGTATIDLPASANFTNNGIFAPGGSPGTLSVSGDFKSTTTSVLDVELFGLTAGTGYDVLAITGNAIFDGSVNLTLNFAAAINDEFIVATTTGTISQCNLVTSTSADFNGMTYAFDVFCRTDNQVVLKVVNIVLGINDFELSESSIQLYPNPVRNQLIIKNVKKLELENAEITDITGKVITTFDLKNMGLSKEISLENLTSGMYFVKINGLYSSITKRVIKE